MALEAKPKEWKAGGGRLLALVAAYTARRATGSRLRGGRAAESRRADPPPYLPGLSQCQCPPHQVLTPIIYPPLPILPRPPHQISNLGCLHLSKQQKTNREFIISVKSSPFLSSAHSLPLPHLDWTIYFHGCSVLPFSSEICPRF